MRPVSEDSNQSNDTGDSDKGDNGTGDADDARLGQLAADVDHAVRKATRTVEFGRRGFAIAVTVFVLLLAELLPWVGDYAGWQVLVGDAGTFAIPRLFAVTSIGIGIVASSLALVTRRWWLTWVCAIGGWFAAVDGLLAVWSQQSVGVNDGGETGPDIGLIIALVVMILLAAQWMRIAWSRR